MKILVMILAGLLTLQAESLFIVKSKNLTEIKNLSAKVIYTDDFISVISSDDEFKFGEKAVSKSDSTSDFIYRFKTGNNLLPDEIADNCREYKIFDGYAIISVDNSKINKIYPEVHGGLVRLFDREVRSTKRNYNYKAPSKSNSLIQSYVDEVDGQRIQDDVQQMEDYGTRNCYKPQSIEAQNWIKEQYEAMGLEVSIQDFNMPSGAASDNVIAIQTGTKYPDEYVVCGGHYDSIISGNNQNVAPGADDNASGTAGAMEIARVLSQYEFDRSIIYCAFSGEEYGLYGSEAYASYAASNNMNILGYFNLDMIAYRHPGDEIHTDIIAPSSALPLVNFYKENAAVYVPSLGVYDGSLSGGDSDHTSFNQNGYMGIFPFEDSQNYSPYIHSVNDLIGQSFNSQEMAELLTKASLASVAIMATDKISDLAGIPDDGQVELVWSVFDDAESYNIYKDGVLLINQLETQYLDLDVTNNQSYTYYVTAVLENGDESLESNQVVVVPRVPLALPFSDDFENGFQPFWEFIDTAWQIASTGYNSSQSAKSGNIVDNQSSGIKIDAVIGQYGGALEFNSKVSSEANYDYLRLKINEIEIEKWSGEESWEQHTYDLNPGLNTIELVYTKDTSVANGSDCAWVDNVMITAVAVGIDENNINDFKLAGVYPNPFNPTTSIGFVLNQRSNIILRVHNSNGELVWKSSELNFNSGKNSVEFDGSKLNSGVYYYTISTEDRSLTGKMLLVK
ncbi:MAG: M28 family peptidase [Candidatus Delongbacteria bacterium]|nr:M28 family peptidase [Candidatus Delongbacteria bacterium]MBN2834862.1 M28 family peptidase [Candidatus Delongbacteria bacterium]